MIDPINIKLKNCCSFHRPIKKWIKDSGKTYI